MTRRHQQIANDLREAISQGRYPVGTALPSESELATAHDVARGTVRQAISTLLAEGLIGSRQGARRVVLSTTPSQSFSQLRSFSEWAHAHGHSAGGAVVSSTRRPADPEEAAQLLLPVGAEILHVARLRTLDGEPVLLERTAYVSWIAEAVERLADDCESVTQGLYDDVGLVLAHGEHRIDAVTAGTLETRELGVRRGSPLLRLRRTTTTAEGHPVETADDRYKPGSVVFAIRNSTQSNPLARKPAG